MVEAESQGLVSTLIFLSLWLQLYFVFLTSCLTIGSGCQSEADYVLES